MRWQIEQKILTNRRRAVDRLGATQLGVYGECGHLNVVHKILQARYATQLHRLSQRASCPKGPSSNAHVDVVMRWAGTTNSFCFKVVDRAILIPVQMQTLRRNLSEMNFHASNPRILSAKFRAQRLGNTSRNKTGDIPAEARDFLNNART